MDRDLVFYSCGLASAIIINKLILYRNEIKFKTEICGIEIYWYDTNLTSDKLNAFRPLKEWIEKLYKKNGLLSSISRHKGGVVKSIEVLSVFERNNKILFLHTNIDVEIEIKQKIRKLPGLTLFRGISVVALLWYRKNDEIYILMIEQPRVPAGSFVWEMPAGMLDGNTLQGAMFNEIKEETGLVINKDRLVSLGNTFASPGILDEEFALYAAYCPEIENAKAGGNYDENEYISKVHAFPKNDIPFDDAKTLVLLSAAERMKIFEFDK